ncbi:hypothetical protein Phum_PHUM240780 [Pediculus humanus corporis]|uniref:RIMS-binding protein 2 n=1 Tax=Pediculus humanus subsp. corporis TaxID=121224 RepID=E0VJ98_PEDHC|nr:uncharacterized protein Phum_PHUM240780 [Pediculus humanus corporis]EEB13454.1 hypothetical protein Phum_PHUM240780 [Pediculus humanus corporis]
MPLGLGGNISNIGNSFALPGVPQTNVLPMRNYCTSVKRMMPLIPTAAPFDIEGTMVGLTPAEQAQLQQLVQHQPATDNSGLPIPDMLDIPGKGRCYVYIAKYSYDPFQQSLNENPEAELSINAGDYLLVWGNIDEDGFCDGELLDGRRGLVPSNFIQKLVGDDLLEFHQSVVLNLRDVDDCNSTTIPQDIDMASQNPDFIGEGVYRRTDGSTYLDLEAEMLLEDEDPNQYMYNEPPADLFFSVLVPAPKQLTLERQLNKSVLIGWNHPDSPSPAPIDSYHVYVDGVLKTTIKASERTRALVEGVDSSRPHRISVRSVTQNRRTSRDAACTMVIGKDVPLGPTCVKASNITSTSAVISWLPSNSNHQHVVCVNNVQVRTVKPGVYRHTITGLAPNTIYRVTVRAKNIRAPHFDEKSQKQLERFSCHMDFRTLSKGQPEAPCDVQVEPGPQDGTLLVTWVPVISNAAANTIPITGYAVYADGKKVTDVDSPTGDHALIDINKLIGLNPKQVTVRTKSREAQSLDSPATIIPQHMLRGKLTTKDGEKQRFGSSVPPHMRQGHHRTRIDQHGQVVIEPEENLSDKEIYPHMKIPAIEITKDSASEANFSEDDFIDGRKNPRGQRMGPDQRVQPMRGPDPSRRMDRGRGGPMYAQQERDLYYVENQRGRGGPMAYRGGPPGRGMGGPPRGVPQTMSQAEQGMASNQSMPGPDKKIRYFVALFDYDPTTMSPNPDACEEELPFNEGDSIKVYGEKDSDGFFWGECRGRKGFVPHNMVMEVQDSKTAENIRGNRDRWGDIYANMPMRKMVALYDYDPQELSPNVDAEVELSFHTGDIIYVYGEMDDDGFYMGELDGIRGLVPSNFLTDAPDDYGEGGTSVQRGGQRGGRGHGPGARGPPPPPRNDLSLNRRKGSKTYTEEKLLKYTGMFV